MTLHIERLGRGPDLVLLHGWGLHGGVWQALAARLAGSFRLHLVDLPGHGLSQGVPFEGFDAVVDRVAECVPEGAGVCGWSLGSLITMRLATRHVSRASFLVLVSATPSFVRRDGWPHAMERATLEEFAGGLATDPATTIRRFVNLNALGGPHARDRMRDLAALLVERATPPAAALAAGLALLHDADLRDEIAAIDRPVVVIHGGRDALAPVAAGRWLAGALPSARLVEIADAAHLPFVSHTETVAQAIESFPGRGRRRESDE